MSQGRRWSEEMGYLWKIFHKGDSYQTLYPKSTWGGQMGIKNSHLIIQGKRPIPSITWGNFPKGSNLRMGGQSGYKGNERGQPHLIMD